MTEFPATLVYDTAIGDGLVAAAKTVVSESGIVRISGFPTDARCYIEFLRSFGTPLVYYGGTTGTHQADSAIWRIKYDIEEARRGDTHAVDGPLAPHSAQSLRVPRPPYFSMLMIDNGWQDRPPGQNGESVFVRWADAFQEMRAELTDYDSILDTLLDDAPYPGNHGERSVAYRLPDAKDEYDFGVRLKSDLAEHLRINAPAHPATAAVQRLCTHAGQTARRVQLDSGDLILLDNDRWGHGREPVAGHTMHDGHPLLNPRELWSVTIG